jgi:catechol 2,3-dioxygenase
MARIDNPSISGANSLLIHNHLRATMHHSEPCYDIAHLAHVELYTPKLEASLAFFVNVLGLTESGRQGDSVYLRAYDDYEFHTLKLTAHHTTGIGHFAYRTASPQALKRRVAALEAAGLGHGWVEGDLGHGQAYVTRTPDGHTIELYHDTHWYEAPPHLKPALKNQMQAYPARGISVRRLDHMNLLVHDVAATRVFLENYLGLRTTEKIVKNDGTEAGAWVTATNKSYDLAFTADYTGEKGRGKARFHHVTYAVDSREDVLRAADICLDAGVHIETGPHKHAVQQTFLYVYEPGGTRVEIANAGARLVLAPDWKPIIWTEADRAKGQAWGLKTIESFHTYGTPPVG